MLKHLTTLRDGGPTAMLFIDNKYTTWYFNIINTAKARVTEGYTEKHHIIPKCLNGSNDPDNIIPLSLREHFLCHMLLPFMVNDEHHKRSLSYAAAMLGRKTGNHRSPQKVNTRLYEKLKTKMYDNMKGNKMSDEAVRKMSISAKKRADNETPEEKERRRKGADTIKGWWKGTKRPHQAGSKNYFSKNKDEIQDIFMKKYGVSNPALIPWQCEHCGKEGKGLSGLKRWHGDNCKHK